MGAMYVKVLFFNDLWMFFCLNAREMFVRNFIYKETENLGNNQKYNKYLCSAKVISFIA